MANNVFDKKLMLLAHLLLANLILACLLFAHLQLQPRRYDLYERKSKNRSRYEMEKAYLQRLPLYHNQLVYLHILSILAINRLTGTPWLQLLPLHYNFYKQKSENQSHLQLLSPQYDFYERKNENRYLQLPVKGTRRASYFRLKNRYLQPAKSQVYVTLDILVG